MSNDAVTQGSEMAASVADVSSDLQVIARSPEEMRQATASLACWMAAKVDICQKDADELAANIEIAERNGWKVDALKRQHRLCVRRVAFYEKMNAALRAGYCIIPNFPIELIAIRTTKSYPERRRNHRWRNEASRDIKSNSPELGDGDNVSAVADVQFDWEYVRDGDGNILKDSDGKPRRRNVWYPSVFDCEIEFPVALAKPAIMSRTAEAMALKCFDEIGVLGVPENQTARGKKPDPMVIGRIIDPRSTASNHRCVSFVIAWYIDASTL